MAETRLNGLIAACCTPMKPGGGLHLDAIPLLAEHYRASGVGGVYVCGSTGEGVSLATDERLAVVEAFAAAASDLRILVNVSHNSIAEACRLAEHAATVGADVISATVPSYYDVASLGLAVRSMKDLAAAAPDVPFYYYHIPSRTHASIDVGQFLGFAQDEIPNLRGVKYTAPTLHEFQYCMGVCSGRFDMVWGVDEMLLGALATGARSAIGSTYNITAPICHQLILHYDRGEMAEARALQSRLVDLVRLLQQYPFLAALKSTLSRSGIPCGPCRVPLASLSQAQEQELYSLLDAFGLDRLLDEAACFIKANATDRSKDQLETRPLSQTAVTPPR